MKIERVTAILLLFMTAGIMACGDAEGAPEEVRDQRLIERSTLNEVENSGETTMESEESLDNAALNNRGSLQSGVSGSGGSKRPGAISGESTDAPVETNDTPTERSGGDQSGAETETTDQPSAGSTEYEPTRFGTLLRANVSGGRVNYAGFAKSSEFATHLESLKTADPGSMSTNEALAFWINAYNALVIKNVNDHPGMKKPTNVSGFFDRTKFKIAGESLTLNDIENKVIRPKFNEPLIHFGLVCAARSCPPLIPQLYTSSNVRSLLAKNASDYLGNEAQNSFDPATGTLKVSKIFEWYIADFGGNNEGIIAFVKKHAPDSMSGEIAKAESVNVTFKEYDWTLNSK